MLANLPNLAAPMPPFQPAGPQAPDASAQRDATESRRVFDEFVGTTFFSQMLSAMRKTVGEPAYFHGGRAEEVFQGQLDQILAEKLSEATAHQFTGPMYELFTATRK